MKPTFFAFGQGSAAAAWGGVTRPHRPPPPAFTLTELLVVIAILPAWRGHSLLAAGGPICVPFPSNTKISRWL
jgi:hypothetical protein